MSAAGVAGPLFISVGQPEQLQKFLDLNPELSQAKALIDDSSDFAAYKAAGFNCATPESRRVFPRYLRHPFMIVCSRCYSPLTKPRVCISLCISACISVCISAVHADLMGDKELAEVPDFKPPKTMGMGKWHRGRTTISKATASAGLQAHVALAMNDVQR